MSRPAPTVTRGYSLWSLVCARLCVAPVPCACACACALRLCPVPVRAPVRCACALCLCRVPMPRAYVHSRDCRHGCRRHLCWRYSSSRWRTRISTQWAVISSTVYGVTIPDLNLGGVLGDRFFNGAVAPVSCMGGDGRLSAWTDAKTRCNSESPTASYEVILMGHSETEAGTRDGSVANGTVAPVLAWGVMVSYRPRKNATARCNRERLQCRKERWKKPHWTWIYPAENIRDQDTVSGVTVHLIRTRC